MPRHPPDSLSNLGKYLENYRFRRRFRESPHADKLRSAENLRDLEVTQKLIRRLMSRLTAKSHV